MDPYTEQSDPRGVDPPIPPGADSAVLPIGRLNHSSFVVAIGLLCSLT